MKRVPRLPPIYSSTAGGVLAALAVSCSSPGSTSGASTGASATAGASAGTSVSGAQAGAGASAGVAATGASGSSSAGAVGGASAGSGSSGASGGGGSDAGNLIDGSDAGSNADGPDGVGAARGCAGKAYKLCEDFESGSVGAVPTGWTTRRGYAARGGIGLASDQAHWGGQSLKSDGANTLQDRVEKSLAGLGATITKHWGRIFYKVGSPPPKPTTGVIHITFAALEGMTENRVVDTVVATNGTHQWLFNIPDDSCCTGSSYDWTFDASWHCAEWSIDVAAASFRFFSDSKEVTQLAFAGKTAAKMSTYTSIALGTIFYQVPPSPVVVWFDDLAIDDTQIGCQ